MDSTNGAPQPIFDPPLRHVLQEYRKMPRSKTGVQVSQQAEVRGVRVAVRIPVRYRRPVHLHEPRPASISMLYRK